MKEMRMVVRAVAAALLIAISLEPSALARQSRESAAQGARATRKNGSIAGRVIHADGAAAEGARVAVYAMREGAPAAIVATATSAYDGRYQVSNLPAGPFAVGVAPQRIRGFGGDSRRLTSPPVETFYPGTTDRLKAEPIEVFDGTATEGIDVWLEPAARRYSISGRALWPEGAGVERVAIEYGGSGVHPGIWYVDDPGGLFTIEGASRGTYVLLARAETSNGPLLGIAATNVVNDSVHDVRLTLREPGHVEGRLIVEGTAGPEPSTLRLTPVPALLTLSPLYPVADATPDSTGRFTMPHLLGQFTIAVNGLPPGWRVRRVTRGGVTLPEQRITVMGGERVTAIEVLVGN
jgi:hypothetical protein